MKSFPRRKIWNLVILTILCIAINYTGKLVSEVLRLPVWMDSVGTVAMAYLYGPVCGAAVGLTSNIVYGVNYWIAMLYGIVSIAIGVATGILARRKVFESFFGTMTACMVITLISVFMSVPLNIIFNDGMTSNLWGDSVICFLTENHWSRLLSCFIGEFYVDFLDKLLTLLLLYFTIAVFRHDAKKSKPSLDRIKRYFSMTMAFVFVFSSVALTSVNAEVPADGQNEPLSLAQTESTVPDYGGFMQTVYNNKNGISCGEANDVVADRDGILWVGTYAGLYRYNGSEFELIDDLESVKNVNCLYIDDEDRMWIGTNDNGITIMKDGSPLGLIDQESGLTSNSIRKIVKASDGYYYVGTSSSMQVLSFENDTIKTVATLDNVNYAQSISINDKGFVAAVNQNGDLYLLKNGKVVDERRLQSEDDFFTGCGFVDGNLYVGTSTTLIKVFTAERDGSKGYKLRETGEIDSDGLHGMNVISPYQDAVFIGAENGIGYMDENRTVHMINTKDFNNSVDNVAVDYQGNVWFASSRLGIIRLCKSRFSNIYDKVGESSGVVNSITVWNGDYYIGTDKGLQIIDKSGKEMKTTPAVELTEGIRVRSVHVDSNNNLWICSYGKGLIEVSPEGETHIYDSSTGAFGNRARVMIELSDGRIAVAGDSGVTIIKNHSIVRNFLYGEELGYSMILSIMETPDGSIIVGSDGEGIYVIKDDQVVKHICRKDGISSDVILRTVYDKDNHGYYVVTSNGICFITDQGEAKILSNFPYSNNYDIWDNGSGKLFVLGSAGIYVVDKERLISGAHIESNVLDLNSGLDNAITANSWNYLDENNILYFACEQGVCKLDLGSYETDENEYRVRLASVLVDGVSCPIEDGELNIERETSRIEFYPEVINYTVENPTVSCWLEGYEGTRHEMTQNNISPISYTNLRPGNYIFHIQVLDSYQASVVAEESYTLNKAKALYDSQWFMAYMLGVMSIAVAWLTWLIARRRIQRVVNFQQKELEFAHEQVRMVNQTILTIAKTVDAKDENTSQHSTRVAEYSVLIGRKLGMSEKEIDDLRYIALLHDIGKIGIPDSILNKNGKLTDEEYEIMKSHVSLGAQILNDFNIVEHVGDGVLYHHERYDGNGYIHHLKGEEIPLTGRIICVADSFDAMTANRVYRKKLDVGFARQELVRCSGTQFDPDIVEIMIGLLDDGSIVVDQQG